ncbi:hypothetical protein IMCC20628_00797 [Hoeflea sp. IMCC20628]|uniref:SGNH hydrolase domain-containing protein n=1 Tax=Hoeflea sp. IMCC20628 TaxID=1620421 RepID=UPI00063BF6E4|nr:SGNH hydrolase domain-containing protein [Hoeflea sp. IMCC20628]AKH99517.1 hypothetical protein IMCC20628_00797 [Hoeflea sp. IMCC20628]
MGPWIWTNYPQQLAPVGQGKAASASPAVCQRPQLEQETLIDENCVLGSGEPTALLYGDSNATHYIGFASALAETAGLTMRNFEHSACPPILTDPEPYVQKRFLESCRYSLEKVRPLLAAYEVVFLGASWPFYERYGKRAGASFERDVRDFIKFLTDEGVRVVVLAKVPIQKNVDNKCAMKAVKAPWIICNLPEGSPRRDIQFNQVLADIADQNDLVRVIDPTDMLCDTKTCHAFEEGMPLYFDSGHLNFKGSWILGRRFAKSAEGAEIISFIRPTE